MLHLKVLLKRSLLHEIFATIQYGWGAMVTLTKLHWPPGKSKPGPILQAANFFYYHDQQLSVSEKHTGLFNSRLTCTNLVLNTHFNQLFDLHTKRNKNDYSRDQQAKS